MRARTSAPLTPCLLAALVLILPACSSGSNLNDDGKLLMAMKSSFVNGDTVLSSWDLARSSPCTGWKFVSCGQTQSYQGRPVLDYQRVTDVRLTGAGLQGSIPDPGWELPERLGVLELDINALQGSLPKRWNLPPVMLYINLGNSSLAGPIPDFQNWGLPSAISNLQMNEGKLLLYLPDNSLAGTLPPLDQLKSAGKVFIKPGNPGLCGEIPSGGGYSGYYEKPTSGKDIPVVGLPKCTEVPSPGLEPPAPPPTPSPNPSSAPSTNPFPPPDNTDTALQEALRGMCVQFLGCLCPGA